MKLLKKLIIPMLLLILATGCNDKARYPYNNGATPESSNSSQISVPTGSEPNDIAPTQAPAHIVYMAPDYLIYDDNNEIIKFTYLKDKVIGYNNSNEEVIRLEFDKNNNTYKKTEYYKTNSHFPFGVITYYNDLGKISSYNQYKAGLGIIEKYEYNDDGAVISVETVYDYADISVFDYSYSGNIKKQTATYKNGSKSEFFYDNGLIIKEKYYDNMLRNGKLAYEISFVYDDFGNIINTNKNYINENGYSVIKTLSEYYDINGNMTNSILTENNTSVNSYYYYDEKSNDIFDINIIKNSYGEKYVIDDMSIGGMVDFIKGPYANVNFKINSENDGYYITINDYVDNNQIKHFLGVKRTIETKGNSYTQTFYDTDGNVLYKYFINYDNRGEKSQDIICNYSNNEENFYIGYKCDYNEKGQVIKIKEYNKEYTTVYDYDIKGKVTQISNLKDNILQNSITFLYHENGNIYNASLFGNSSQIQFVFDQDGNLKNTIIDKNNISYLFNSNHLLVNKNFMDNEGIKHTFLVDYINDKLINKCTEYINENEIVCTIDYLYDSKNNKTGWLMNDAGGNLIFKYNENTLLQSEAEYDNNGMLLSLSTYDGNCRNLKVVFKSVGKEIYDIYQKCNIFDLIPKY